MSIRPPISAEILRILASHLFGGLVALIAIAIMAGWILHRPELIQVRPEWAPVQFNAALGILLCAIAVLFLGAIRRPVAARICGLSAALLGGVTLLQYLLDLNFGIDQLFIDSYILVETSHPGRMAPNTGIALLFCGLGLSAQSLQISLPIGRSLINATLGFVVMLLAFIALYGYVEGYIHAYGWDRYTRMAFLTALAFFLLGLSMLLLALREQLVREAAPTQIRNSVLTASAFAIAATGTIIASQALISMSGRQLQAEEQRLADVTRNNALLWSQKLQTLQASATQLANRGSLSLLNTENRDQNQWQGALDAELSFNEELIAIARLDDRGLPIATAGSMPSPRHWPVLSLSGKQTLTGPLTHEGRAVFLIRTPLGNNSDDSSGSEISVYDTSRLGLLISGVEELNADSRLYLHREGGFTLDLGATRIVTADTMGGFDEHLKNRQPDAATGTEEPGEYRLLKTRLSSHSTPSLMSYYPADEAGLWLVMVTPLSALADLNLLPELRPLALSLLIWILVCVVGLMILIRPLIDGFLQHAANLRVSLDTQRKELTQRRALQRELEQKQLELQTVNAELARFATVAAHDLKEPVRVVSNYMGLLKMRYSENLDEKGRQYLDNSIAAAERAVKLNDDLLAMAKVGSSKIAMTAIDVDEPLSDALADLETLIEETEGKVRCDKMPTLVAEKRQLQQLFNNLIHNALTFCENRKPEVHVSAREIDTGWEFCVRDNGIGIDPVFADRIFEGFSRLHTRAKFAGSGLGLAICKRIVEHHGGKIWVKSQEGVGSRFFFTISSDLIAATASQD